MRRNITADHTHKHPSHSGLVPMPAIAGRCKCQFNRSICSGCEITINIIHRNAYIGSVSGSCRSGGRGGGYNNNSRIDLKLNKLDNMPKTTMIAGRWTPYAAQYIGPAGDVCYTQYGYGSGPGAHMPLCIVPSLILFYCSVFWLHICSRLNRTPHSNRVNLKHPMERLALPMLHQHLSLECECVCVQSDEMWNDKIAVCGARPRRMFTYCMQM